MTAQKILLLVDGHAVLHRAYHALPPLNDRRGRLVNAVYGFFRLLNRLVNDFHPHYLAVAFDTPKPTFRHQQFVGYQIKRPKMPADLAEQIKMVREILRRAGIKIFMKEGYEADDLLGTILQRVKKLDLEAIVVTGDKDLMQLVNKKARLLMFKRGLGENILVGEKEVEKELGVAPSQVVDYKALAGDASDNYPGVAGVGPKTAVKLLKKFGNLDNIYSHLDEIEPLSLREKLKAGKEAAYLSRQLAEVRRDVPVKIVIKGLRWRPEKGENLAKEFVRLGFQSLLRKPPPKAASSRQIGLFGKV